MKRKSGQIMNYQYLVTYRGGSNFMIFVLSIVSVALNFS